MAIRKTSKQGSSMRRPAKRSGNKARTAQQELLEVILEIGRSISAQDQARHPIDGAKNIDHYLYGSPREDED